MLIDKEELHRLYMEWVNQVADDCDWKTHFGTEEIVHAIAHIIETNPQLLGKEDKTFKQKSKWTEVDNMTRR
jgi:hypothetical protein